MNVDCRMIAHFPIRRRSILFDFHLALSCLGAESRFEDCHFRMLLETFFDAPSKIRDGLKNIGTAMIAIQHGLRPVAMIATDVQDDRIRRERIIQAKSCITLQSKPDTDSFLKFFLRIMMFFHIQDLAFSFPL